MHLIHLTCLFYMFFKILRFIDFLTILGLRFGFLMLTSTCIYMRQSTNYAMYMLNFFYFLHIYVDFLCSHIQTLNLSLQTLVLETFV